MMIMKIASTILLTTILSCAASAVTAQGMSPEKVSKGFSDGVTKYCMKAALAGMGIGELSEAARQGLSKGDEAGRFMVQQENPSGPIWNVDSALGVVLISEPKPGQCDVVAYGAPVSRTFDAVRKSAKVAYSTLVDGPRLSENMVFADEFTVSDADSTMVVRLTGNEPGAPGRMFRFSMLNASVRQAPAATAGQ